MTKIKITAAARRFLSQGRDGEITYMLRSCAADRTAHGGFKWPAKGRVEAPDWSPEPVCGYGLHGLLMGAGDVSLTAKDDPNAVWLVCAVWSDDVINLLGKVKVPRAWVVFSGSRSEAVAVMQQLGGRLCVYGTVTAGVYGTATAGNGGTATAGYRGTATAGYRGTATAGVYGTVTAGVYGTATAGAYGTATVGARGTATAGARGMATAGVYGTATAGVYGTATAGYHGTATAGDGGKATAGARGTATAGHGGALVIRWTENDQRRLAVAYVGEAGIEPNVAYRLDNEGRFVRA